MWGSDEITQKIILVRAGWSVVRRRNLRQGRRRVALRVPGRRPARAGHHAPVSKRRDGHGARQFFQRTLDTVKVTPSEVVTGKPPVYPRMLDEFVPAARHHIEQYENNRIEADHGRLKHRLRPMRRLRTDRTAPSRHRRTRRHTESPPRPLRTHLRNPRPGYESPPRSPNWPTRSETWTCATSACPPVTQPTARAHVVVLTDGRSIDVPEPPPTDLTAPESPAPPVESAVAIDKTRSAYRSDVWPGPALTTTGGDANVGIWVRTDAAWDWLRSALSVEWLRSALQEAAALPVSRDELPNLRALNFVGHDGDISA